jgi:hypothetical protein
MHINLSCSRFCQIVTVLFLASCILLIAIIFMMYPKVHSIKNSIAAVQEFGGTVEFSNFIDESGNPIKIPSVPVGSPSIWERLIALCGAEWFYEVRSVNLQGSHFTDSDMSILNSFSDLRILTLDRTSITDKGICQLNNLKSLRYISLDDTNVSEEGFNELQRRMPLLTTNNYFEFKKIKGLMNSIESTSEESIHILIEH